MKSIQHKTHRDNRFGTIHLACEEDNRISAVAKALHTYALTRPKDWDWHMQDVFNRFKEGRDALYNAVNELIEFGYCYRPDKKGLPRKGGMRFDIAEIHWYEDPAENPHFTQPITEIAEPVPFPDSPYTESPDTAQPDTVDQDTYYIPREVFTREVSTNVASTTPTEDDMPHECSWCKPPEDGQGESAQCVQLWHDLLKAKTGVCHKPTGRTFGNWKTALKSRDLDELQALMRHWFAGYGAWCEYRLQTFIGDLDAVEVAMKNGGNGKTRGGYDQIDECRKAMESLRGSE